MEPRRLILVGMGIILDGQGARLNITSAFDSLESSKSNPHGTGFPWCVCVLGLSTQTRIRGCLCATIRPFVWVTVISCRTFRPTESAPDKRNKACGKITPYEKVPFRIEFKISTLLFYRKGFGFATENVLSNCPHLRFGESKSQSPFGETDMA